MKRLISICLAVCMIFSVLSFSYAADGGDAAQMQNVLAKVKLKLDIPKEYSEFEYSVYTNNGAERWTFSWSSKSDAGIQVQADGKGHILSYDRWSHSNQNSSKAPNLSRSEAQAKALAFIKKTMPEMAASLSKEPSCNVYAYSNAYGFTYQRYEHDILCENQNVRVEVNYINGEVTQASATWLYDVKYDKVANPITEEDARKIWKDKADMQLMYLYKYDDDYKSAKAYLAYVQKEQLKAINAQTGEILEKNYEWVQDSVASAPESSIAGGSGSNDSNLKVEFTPQELNKIAELNSLLTAAQADRKVRAIAHLSLTSEFRLSSSNLISDKGAVPLAKDSAAEDAKHSWSLVYTGPVSKEKNPQTINVRVDAKTGALEYYSDYSAKRLNMNKMPKIGEEKAIETAKSFIRNVCPEKADNVMDAETDKEVVFNASNTQVHTGWAINFSRKHGDIRVAGDGVNVNVNRMTGKVTQYSSYWEDNVEFEDAQGIIDADAALDAYIANADVSLSYRIFTTYLYDEKSRVLEAAGKAVMPTPIGNVRNEKSVILVYTFDTPSNEISAKTGEYVVWYKNDDSVFNGYTDIKGHFAEREISMLVDIGVLPERDKFMPYKAVTQKEFMEYLLANRYSYTENDIVSLAEKNPDGIVTRNQAVKYIVQYMGFGKIASDPSIFKVGFADAATIPGEYLGSVAIAKSMGIVGGSNGRFNGNNALTNGEAAKMIYNMLKVMGQN